MTAPPHLHFHEASTVLRLAWLKQEKKGEDEKTQEPSIWDSSPMIKLVLTRAEANFLLLED